MGSISFRSFRRLTIGGTLFLALIVSMSSARAFTFTINPALSSLTLSGSIAGTAFGQQGAGSLVTNYTGTIDSSFTGSTITFNSAARARILTASGSLSLVARLELRRLIME